MQSPDKNTFFSSGIIIYMLGCFFSVVCIWKTYIKTSNVHYANNKLMSIMNIRETARQSANIFSGLARGVHDQLNKLDNSRSIYALHLAHVRNIFKMCIYGSRRFFNGNTKDAVLLSCVSVMSARGMCEENILEWIK